MNYTRIVCGGSPTVHYIPTGTTQPFTLDWSPLNEGSSPSVAIPSFGVSSDYTSFWFKTGNEYGYYGDDVEYILRATYEDESYEDITFIFPTSYNRTYLSDTQLNTKSWGYIVNADSELAIVPVNASTHTNSTTYSWINLSGDTVTFDSNTSDEPRTGDIFVETPDELIIFSIIQRPDEQSDYFLLPSKHNVPLEGDTRTIYIKSLSDKPIKRWWVLLKKSSYDDEIEDEYDYYYGDGDNPSFDVTVQSSSTGRSIYATLVVEDTDGNVWNNCCAPSTLLHQYRTDVTNVFYYSKDRFDPYQSFIAVIQEESANPYFLCIQDSTKSYLTEITKTGYSYIETPIVPFGTGIWFGDESEISENYDYLYTPVKLVEVSDEENIVNIPFEEYVDRSARYSKSTIASPDITYSTSSGNATISANTETSEVQKYLERIYGSSVLTALVPIVQAEYDPTPNPEDSTIEVTVGGGTYEIGPYDTVNWTITSYPDWVVPSATSGDGNSYFTIDVKQNISSSSRSGEIIVQYGTSYYTVTINQEALDAGFYNVPAVSTDNKGVSQSVGIYYNLQPTSISSTVNDDWASDGSWYYGSDYGSCIISVPSIGGIVNRSTTFVVTLHYGEESYEIFGNIVQQGSNYTITPETATVDAEGGTVVTTITSDYPLSGYDSVIGMVNGTATFNRISDTEIQVVIEMPANTGAERTENPILYSSTSGIDSVSLTAITQNAFELEWDFPTDPIHLEAEKSTFELAFTSNVEISNITISNAPTWITFTRDGDKYVGVAVQNKSDERSATVTFTADDWDVSKMIEITQDGLYWEFATDSVHIGVEASTFDLPYTSNIEIKSFIVYDKPNWLTFKRGDSKYTITATRNTGESRTATVTFNIYGSATSRKVVFTQDGFEWVLDANSIEFNSTNSTPDNPAANPMTESISFTSTLPITELEATIQYLSGSDWLSVDYNGDIIVTALDNRLGTYREAVITLYSSEYDLSRQITVTQLGSSFTWDASTIDISPAGGVATFNYTGSNGFLLLSDISVENAELAWSFNGGYNGSISFTVPINTGIARIFNPKVYAGDRLLTTFTINQADPNITVDTPEIIAPAEVTDVIVYIESDIPWYSEIVGDWISVNPSSGSGDAGINITIDANPLAEIRTGYVYISNGVDREVIVINQAGAEPYLYFTKKYIPLPLAGGVRYVKLVNNTYWTTKWETQ